METQPDVTVVIPAWDVDDVLGDCLASVQQQTMSPVVIVVDNASASPPAVPDGVDVIRLPKRVSVGAARNVGLAAVTTPYVLFLDADDVLLPSALESLCRRLQQNPSLVGVSGGIVAWNPESDRRVPARWPFRWAVRIHRRRKLFAVINCVRNLFPTVGPVALSTEAVRASGGFGDASWGEDWALGASLCFCGDVAMFDEPCELYRIDSRRRTLSDLKAEEGWRGAWNGRALIRQRLRKSRVVPWWARSLPRVLLPLHFVYALQDLVLGRQRVE
jgi:glycosyltransferase involved in cell wall biosynthesis